MNDPAETDGAPPPRRRALKHAAWVAPTVLGVALVARLPGLLHQEFDSDEGAIATMGMVVARGGVVYRDVIDRKPPLSAFVYAASFLVTGHRDLRVLHLVAALGLTAAAVALGWGARRVAGPVAGWWTAGLLIASTTAMRPTAAQAANFAHLALLPGCGAIVAARSGSRRSAVLAGFLVGVATLTRQTWAIGVLPAAYGAWWWGERKVSRALLVVVTTAVTVAAVGLIVPFGAFWHWTFSGNGSVLALDESDFVLERGALALVLFLLANLGACWLIVRRGWHRSDLDLWLWLATGLIAFAAGFRFFDHYWLQVLPAVCLLGGLGAAACRPSSRRMLLVVVAVPALVAWVIAFSPRGEGRTTIRALATYARQHTHDGELVTVWGNAPEVYWRSGRAPGGAMVNTDFVTGKTAWRPNGPQRLRDATPGARADFLRSLRTHPPTLFFDTSTAGLRQYRKYPISLVPELQSFIRRHYYQVATIRGVAIYRLRSSPTTPASGG